MSPARNDGESSRLAPCCDLYLLNREILRNGRKIKRPLRRNGYRKPHSIHQFQQIYTTRKNRNLIVFERRPTWQCDAETVWAFDRKVSVASRRGIHTRKCISDVCTSSEAVSPPTGQKLCGGRGSNFYVQRFKDIPRLT